MQAFKTSTTRSFKKRWYAVKTSTWTNLLLCLLLCNICVGTCTVSAIVLKVTYMIPNSDRKIKGRKEILFLI